ncbi:hypothetical protein FPV67DRAFT_1444204 [Lyophyllum atratum]|nr:hypothetical protein FPV67DRAFT_1444204 [Lyophyllum atratum]
MMEETAYFREVQRREYYSFLICPPTNPLTQEEQKLEILHPYTMFTIYTLKIQCDHDCDSLDTCIRPMCMKLPLLPIYLYRFPKKKPTFIMSRSLEYFLPPRNPSLFRKMGDGLIPYDVYNPFIGAFTPANMMGPEEYAYGGFLIYRRVDLFDSDCPKLAHIIRKLHRRIQCSYKNQIELPIPEILKSVPTSNMEKQAIENSTPAVKETKSDTEAGKDQGVSVESVLDRLDRLNMKPNCNFCGQPKMVNGWALFPAKGLRDRLKEGQDTVEWEDWTRKRHCVICRSCIEASIEEQKKVFGAWGGGDIDLGPELEPPVGWTHRDGWEVRES